MSPIAELCTAAYVLLAAQGPFVYEHQGRKQVFEFRPTEIADNVTAQDVDDYLYPLYQQTIIADYGGPFPEKDVRAAFRVGMTRKQYVIGGIKRELKNRLYCLFRAAEDSGFLPGIKAGFRDDFRQAMVSDKLELRGRKIKVPKARPGWSYHGGSIITRGWGDGQAIDVASRSLYWSDNWYADNVQEQSNWPFYTWIDWVGCNISGLGRPYLYKDAPHVALCSGPEYQSKTGLRARLVALAHKAQHKVSAIFHKVAHRRV
jgi:hypothetical protein